MFAAYIAGTAAMVGMDFGAKFLGSLASAFEVSLNCHDIVTKTQFKMYNLSYITIVGFFGVL